MKNQFKLILAILIIVIIGTLLFYPKKIQAPTDGNSSAIPEESIKGCYVAHLMKDVFTLDITSEQSDLIEGTLDINNYEKDSSTGPIKGTYKDGILLADYTFLSEGTTSLAQVVFKKIGNDFVRGYGETDTSGQFFKDLHNVIFDTSVVYMVSANGCSTSSELGV